MSEMEERVAKVICEALFGSFMDVELDRPSSVSAQSVTTARAVIRAMREPTEAMDDAGLNVGPDRAPSAYWDAMIGAALD